ncbi:unnamed protein product, partial [marine sediment metagenome]
MIKKMTQTYGRIIEIEVEQTEVQISKERKMDELLGDLNPRYFEEAMTPENALDKVYSTKISNNLI